jgi:hypothetical protein
VTDARTFYARGAGRESAARFILHEAPEGWKITVQEPPRGLDINAAFHAACGEASDNMEWAGRKWPLEVWKRLFVAAWSRAKGEHVQLVPALDGNGFDIVMIRTSKMSQSDMRDLMGWVDAFMAARTGDTAGSEAPMRAMNDTA